MNRLAAPMGVPPALSDRVSVVVVCFNSAHCMPALAPALGALRHVLVVDNASSDDSAAQVARHLPHARWLPQPRNLGFGAANNIGIALCSTEFVLLLNPDCVPEPTALQALVDAADTCPEAALVAPQLLGRRGEADISYRWRSDSWRSRGPGADALACVGFASGACLLVRRAALQRIGGFDEGFFLYYEDDDLCLRLQDQAGALLLAPLARVQHLSRSSVAGPARLQAEYLRGYHHIQSKFHFQAKHLGRRTPLPRRLAYAAVAALETALRLLMLDTRRAWRCAGRVAGACTYHV